MPFDLGPVEHWHGGSSFVSVRCIGFLQPLIKLQKREDNLSTTAQCQRRAEHY